MRELHRELSTIKDAALERIAAGEAGSVPLVSSLFSHIGDVRAYLFGLEGNGPHLRSDEARASGNADSPPE